MSLEEIIIVGVIGFIGIGLPVIAIIQDIVNYGPGPFLKTCGVLIMMAFIVGAIYGTINGVSADSERPAGESAYGWYEYAITSAETSHKADYYDSGLLIAEFKGDITDTEYDTLHELAEKTFDALLEQEKEAEE